ncbi:uncharacterized protein [Dysidea avara]|uniref:uncharacterized protein isoform X2 n=1 Tax=Dysidea avara TaxID=196820 RepID=UPI003333029F
MDDKLEGKRLKEKRRVIKISEAYRKLYTVLKFDDATKRKVSRNALLRAAIDYINTLQSRTDMVQNSPVCITPSPHAPWPQPQSAQPHFMNPDQQCVNHSQRLWPVNDWSQPPPHVDTSPITTPHWPTLPTPLPTLPVMKQQYCHVQGEWMNTPPQENELYQPYTGDLSLPHEEWPEIPSIHDILMRPTRQPF